MLMQLPLLSFVLGFFPLWKWYFGEISTISIKAVSTEVVFNQRLEYQSHDCMMVC